MIGSPNPGYFTYDGDQSTSLDPDESPPRVPEGSAGIERTFVAYLTNAGKTAEDTSFDGRSDYDGFTQAGIPSGGLFTGAEEKKTPSRPSCGAARPTSRSTRTTTSRPTPSSTIDRTALGINGGGVAYAVGLYAQDIGGPQRRAGSRRPHPPRARLVIANARHAIGAGRRMRPP